MGRETFMTGANWIEPISRMSPGVVQVTPEHGEKKGDQASGRVCKRMFGTMGRWCSTSRRSLVQLRVNRQPVHMMRRLDRCYVTARTAGEKAGEVQRKREKVFSLRSTCPPLRSLLLFTSCPAANKNRSQSSAAARCPVGAAAAAPATLQAPNLRGR